jgi:hypothetical protein
MSRKKLQTGSTTTNTPSFNSLVKQLETPRAFINLLPEDTRIAVLTIPDQLLNIEEEELMSRLPASFSPTAIMDALRFNFWMEHDRVVATKTEVMNMQTVHFGVCTREYWHTISTEKLHVMAYILCRPPQYSAMMNALSSQWTKRLRDILNIPIKKPNGEYQEPKILELILKAGAMVDLRTQGGYITRSETKNLTYMETKNSNSSVTKIFTAASSNQSVEQIENEIDEKLKLLERDLSPAKPPEPSNPDVIDAEFTEVKK